MMVMTMAVMMVMIMTADDYLATKTRTASLIYYSTYRTLSSSSASL